MDYNLKLQLRTVRRVSDAILCYVRMRPRVIYKFLNGDLVAYCSKLEHNFAINPCRASAFIFPLVVTILCHEFHGY